jgi:hypothetical protein
MEGDRGTDDDRDVGYYQGYAVLERRGSVSTTGKRLFYVRGSTSTRAAIMTLIPASSKMRAACTSDT